MFVSAADQAIWNQLKLNEFLLAPAGGGQQNVLELALAGEAASELCWLFHDMHAADQRRVR